MRYVVEHTIVEAFESQIHTGVDFGAFIEPIERTLEHQLPSPGMYKLTFPTDPTRGLKRNALGKVQREVIDWVKLKAAELHAECPQQPEKRYKPRGHRGHRKGTVAGIDLILDRETGWWMPEKAKGRLFAARFAPKDYEQLRRERITKALNKKLPKLHKCKMTGARSLLVLESGDIALSNHVNILEATEHSLKDRDDIPDEVWLVDTTIEKNWTVWCLMRDGQSFPDEETPVRYREFDPNSLAEV
jgi:hypothetical protein